MAALHDGADQETGLAAAPAALQNTRSGDNAVGFGDHAAMWADKAVRPAGALKIGGARRVIGKLQLELRERLGKSQIVALVDVHGSHCEQTLTLVGACVNRIGTVHSPTGNPSTSHTKAADITCKRISGIGHNRTNHTLKYHFLSPDILNIF